MVSAVSMTTIVFFTYRCCLLLFLPSSSSSSSSSLLLPLLFVFDSCKKVLHIDGHQLLLLSSLLSNCCCSYGRRWALRAAWCAPSCTLKPRAVTAGHQRLHVPMLGCCSGTILKLPYYGDIPKSMVSELWSLNSSS